MKNAAPNLKTIVVTDRGSCEAKALHYAELIDTQPKSPPRDQELMHEAAYILYTSGHNRSREGRSAHGARDAMGNCGLLDPDHGLERARYRALATAVVSFLCA